MINFQPNFYKIKKVLYIFLAQVLTLFFLVGAIALGGQFYTFFKPGYENLDVIPDRQIGWRLMPNSLFTYTGMHWYENEFKTQLKINSLGFRDEERAIKKQKWSTRIAVIGDSFVVAREVPFDKTPSQLLEKYLNESNSEGISTKQKYEVLNFGTTGFGIPQSLLTHRIYVKDFVPEYVFLFIFEETLWRTVSISHAITNTMNQNKKLHIRPIFNMDEKQLYDLLDILNFKEFYQFLVALEKNKLSSGKFIPLSEKEYLEFIEKQRSLITRSKINEISERLKEMKIMSFGPDDFDKFVNLQNHTIKSKFDGQRTRKREQKLFILDLWSRLLSGFQIFKRVIQPHLKMQDEMEKLLSIYAPRESNKLFTGSQDFANLEKVIFVNLKTIDIMNNDIKSYGGKLIIVDSTANLIAKGRLPAVLISTILENYCAVNHIGYIPLYKNLDFENFNGNKTRWSRDGHFNELGTRVFAKSMYRWLQSNAVDRTLNN
jgi:hypothetical protein